jgi:hypothetical protein
MMNLSEVHARRQPGRKPVGMAAVLLPFDESGNIAEEAYVNCLQDTIKAGLTPAVNMDTGYVNLLTDSEKARVLHIVKEALGGSGAPFVAGAFIEGQDGDVVRSVPTRDRAYRRPRRDTDSVPDIAAAQPARRRCCRCLRPGHPRRSHRLCL